MECNITLPAGAEKIITSLQENGFDAYVVGGCVRDYLFGMKPHDWDICTSARPEEVERCFAGQRIIETGLKHGTVTVIQDGAAYEVTTMRLDGNYSDGRRPDSVAFTSSLFDDLSRRDFTINAMAFHPERGLIDPFHGKDDLDHRLLRCVGSPDARFHEDALRVLRALRFSSCCDLQIEEGTAASIHRNAKRLVETTAPERIQAELSRLLCGCNVLRVLLDFSDVITEIIPELKPCIGFQQNNPYHQYTVYDHTAYAVDYSAANRGVSIPLALLLHDIGKPLCYTEDEKGGHFHGHGVFSRDIAERVLDRLRFDGKTKEEVLELVLYHDSVIETTKKTVRRWLNKIGEERFYQLLEVRMADILAHRIGTQGSRIERCEKLRLLCDEIVSERSCFQLKDMKLNGNDLLDLGVPEGKQIGQILRQLLEEVMDGVLENRHRALLDRARELI